jgi:hypothetical protein
MAKIYKVQNSVDERQPETTQGINTPDQKTDDRGADQQLN